MYKVFKGWSFYSSLAFSFCSFNIFLFLLCIILIEFLLFLSLSKLFIKLSSKIFLFLEYTCNVVWLWSHTRLNFVCYFFFRNQCIRFLKDDLFILHCCESLYSFSFPLFLSLKWIKSMGQWILVFVIREISFPLKSFVFNLKILIKNFISMY